MAKRFTDNEKWKKAFIRSLLGPYKVLWVYILDECDHAGIWHIEFDVAQIRIGSDLAIDKEKAIEYFKDKIKIIDNDKWYIKDFCYFQYGTLSENNRMHNSVINLLKRYNLYKDYIRSLQGAKDKDKVKDKDKDKDKDREFEELYKRYPRKEGLKNAKKHFMSTVKDSDMEDIKKALDNYLIYIESNKVEPKYIKMASTWFNDWKDWVEYVSPVSPKEDLDKKLGYTKVREM